MNVVDYIESKRENNLNELKEFLRIPSVSAKSEHKPDIEKAAHWVAEKLRGAGLDKVEIVPTKMHPLVYGESLQAPGKPTVLIYGHYDVQPAEPLDLWTTPAFEPTVRDGNLFGRGTADDKGQVHIHIKALEALRAADGKLPINVKVMVEGEEEVGSVSLWDFVRANRERLKADALIVSDTSMLAKGVPSITYGLRGLNYYQIELTGPAQDLHSGVFGGAVPNPITILAEMIAKLHDKNFHVTVPGFYDDVAVLSRQERKALNSLPWKEKEFRKTVGAPALCGEKGYTIVEQLWTRPTLETEWHLGRIHRRRREDRDSVEGLREALDAARAESGSREDREAGGTAHPEAAAENGDVQIRSVEHGQAVGSAVYASDFPESDSRAGGGLREKGGLHPRGRLDSVRDADARHVQSSLRPARIRIAG